MRHELIFALELHRAECEFLTGALAAAESACRAVKPRRRTSSTSPLSPACGWTLYTTLDRSDRSIEVALDYLRRVGVEWSAHPTKEEVDAEYERIWRQLGSRPIEDTRSTCRLMTDPDWRATMDVLTAVVSPAMFTDENLPCLVICRMANLSLEHGNSDGSCFAYVWLGVVLGPHFGDYQAGFRFGQLGFDLVESAGCDRFKARVYLIFGHHVMPWTKPIRTGRGLMRRAFDAAKKLGDLTFAAYSRTHLITNLLASGDPLDEVQREAEAGLDFARQARFGLVVDMITAQLRLIRTLRGLTPKFGSFDDDRVRRGQVRAASGGRSAPGDSPPAGTGSASCRRASSPATTLPRSRRRRRRERLLWTSPSFFEAGGIPFLCRAGAGCALRCGPAEERTQHLEALAAHHRQLQSWAENCPENFANRAALVGAEIARLEGRDSMPSASTNRPSARPAPTASSTTRRSPTNSPPASTRRVASRGLPMRICRTPGTAICAGEPTARCGNSTRCIRTSGRKSRRPLPTSTIGAPVEHLDLATVIKVVAGRLRRDRPGKLIERSCARRLSMRVPSEAC